MNGGFDRVASILARKARRIAEARAAARLARQRRQGDHWRSAPFLWPTFGAGD